MNEPASLVDHYTELQSIPHEMALEIAPLYVNADLERYARFLNAMYHYTIRSEEQLRKAAELTDNASLRALFLEMADEERGHYKLAEMDLKAIGREVDQTMPVSVHRMHDFWEGVEQDKVMMLLGALYVFENVAGHAGESAMSALTEMGLDNTQTRFVAVHVSADEHHGRMVDDLCKANMDRYGAEILAGAQQAADRWVAMHLDVI